MAWHTYSPVYRALRGARFQPDPTLASHATQLPSRREYLRAPGTARQKKTGDAAPVGAASPVHHHVRRTDPLQARPHPLCVTFVRVRPAIECPSYVPSSVWFRRPSAACSLKPYWDDHGYRSHQSFQAGAWPHEACADSQRLRPHLQADGPRAAAIAAYDVV